MRTQIAIDVAWIKAAEELEPKDFADYLGAITHYQYNQTLPKQLCPIASTLFYEVVKPQIDVRLIKVRNGKMGGRPSKVYISEKPNKNQNDLETKTKAKPNENLNQPEMIRNKVTAKTGLVPCTEEELRYIADTKNFSLSEVRRIHDDMMLKIADGIFQKKKYGNTVYFTLMVWVSMYKKRLQESGGGAMGRMTERDGKIMMRRLYPHLNLYPGEDLS